MDWGLVRRLGKECEQMRLTKHKHMLYTMVAGGIWTLERQFTTLTHTGDLLPTCPRCGNAHDTEYHRYWECVDNDGITQMDVQSTQWMMGQGRRSGEIRWPDIAHGGSQNNPSLYLRGAPGSDLFRVDLTRNPFSKAPSRFQIDTQASVETDMNFTLTPVADHIADGPSLGK